MELITFDHLDTESSTLEYRLKDENKSQYLTNVAEHISDVYKFRKPPKGAEGHKFIIKYSGNKKSSTEDRDIAQYVIIKEKEVTRYLIAVDAFQSTFTQI
jgi:hypothetical protein